MLRYTNNIKVTKENQELQLQNETNSKISRRDSTPLWGFSTPQCHCSQMLGQMKLRKKEKEYQEISKEILMGSSLFQGNFYVNPLVKKFQPHLKH